MLNSPSSNMVNISEIGREAYESIRKLYPISRSITGEGVRTTLRTVQQHIPLEIVEVPSGTKVFDWTVPPEWNIKVAYIKNRQGDRILDFRECNLHVVGYHVPVHAKLTLSELKPHLFTIPERPEWIPFRTTFYHKNWGFCLSISNSRG